MDRHTLNNLNMKPITYQLKQNGNDSSPFYNDLEVFTSSILTETKHRFGLVLKNYQHFITSRKIEKLRHHDEYLLELLMLGVFWNQYNNRIRLTNALFLKLFKSLYLLRNKHQRMKPVLDSIRGYFASVVLDKTTESKKPSPVNVKRMLDWMDCTNEFNDEVKRLRQWHRYMKKMHRKDATHLLESILSFAHAFEQKAANRFGMYTNRVHGFIQSQKKNHRKQENYFFIGRSEVEYHLNMVGAAILNRVLKTAFQRTANQTVLLPTCMSSGNPCRAKRSGKDLICTHCSLHCRISQISQNLEKEGIRTVLIPHSSKFTQWLKPYANQQETGLVGVACILNLLKGGYEMKNLNIPSQCVFLDHCGCKKHWHNEGIPTDLNFKQLQSVMPKVNAPSKKCMC